MQFVYATHIPLRPSTPSPMPPEEGAKRLVSQWVKERAGIEIADWAGGAGQDRDRSAQWGTLVGNAGRVARLVLRQPDSSSPWAWLTSIWIGRDEAGAWIRLRIGLEPRYEGVVIDPSVSVGAPRFLNSLASQYLVEVDGQPIEQYRTVATADAQQYVAFLESHERQLPVLAVTRVSGGSPEVAPQSLSRRLSGIAHVVAIEPSATYDVSDLITPTRSVFGGAVRVYWPGFNRGAHPYRHPLYMHPGRRGADAFVDEIAARLGRAAGTAFGPPALEGVLRREAAMKAAEAARVRRDEQKVAALDVQGGLTADEFSAFSKEFDDLSDAKQLADERVLELELELEAEREANAAQRQAWASLGIDQTEPSGDEPAERVPTTVEEAVEIAEACCPDLVFTQSAYESARESQYGNAQQVLDDLRVLQEVAHLWASSAMSGDFRTEFESRPVTFRPGVSRTAHSTYEADYAITYRGQKVLMGPHLRRGVGAPPTILRIYWYKDDGDMKLVVGHVGRKLRDDSNRN